MVKSISLDFNRVTESF